jgi:hypothetical protein
MEVLNVSVGLANLAILYVTVLHFGLGIPLIILVNVAANLGLMAARFAIPREENGGNPLLWMLGINVVVLIASFVILTRRFSVWASTGILIAIGLLFGLVMAGYMIGKLKGIADVMKKMPSQ